MSGLAGQRTQAFSPNVEQMPEIGGAVRNATAELGPRFDDDDTDRSCRRPLEVYGSKGSRSTAADNADDLGPPGHRSIVFL